METARPSGLVRMRFREDEESEFWNSGTLEHWNSRNEEGPVMSTGPSFVVSVLTATGLVAGRLQYVLRARVDGDRSVRALAENGLASGIGTVFGPN